MQPFSLSIDFFLIKGCSGQETKIERSPKAIPEIPKYQQIMTIRSPLCSLIRGIAVNQGDRYLIFAVIFCNIRAKDAIPVSIIAYLVHPVLTCFSKTLRRLRDSQVKTLLKSQL